MNSISRLVAWANAHFDLTPRTLKAIATAFVGLLVVTGRLPKDRADVWIGLTVVVCAALRSERGRVELPPDTTTSAPDPQP